MRLIKLARFYSSKQGQSLGRLFVACRVFTVWKLKGLQPAAIGEVENKLKENTSSGIHLYQFRTAFSLLQK